MESRPDTGSADAAPPRLLSSVLHTSGATAAGASLAMAVALYSAGALGPTDRGRFVALVTGAALASLAGALGVSSAGRRLLVDAEKGISLSEYVSTCVPLVLIGTTLGLAVGLTASPVVGLELATSTALAIALLGGTGTANILLLDAVNAQGRTVRSAVLAAGGTFVTLGALVLIEARRGITLDTAITAVLAGSLTTNILLIGALRVPFRWGGGGTKWGLVRAGIALTPFALAQALALRLDRVLFPALGSAADAGVYSIAAALAETLRFGSSALAQQLVFRSATGQLTHQAHLKALRVTVAVQVALAALIGAAAILVLPALIGDDYASVPKLFAMMVVGEIFMTWYLVSSRVLLGRGATTVLSVGAAIGALTMIVGDVLLIPRFGAEGAAIASVVAYAVLALTAARALKNRSVSQS